MALVERAGSSGLDRSYAAQRVGNVPTLSFSFRLVMIRTVAFKKAIAAGTIGAFVWEVSVRPLIWLGVPMFDLVRVLGTMVVGGETGAWRWWIVGMVMPPL